VNESLKRGRYVLLGLFSDGAQGKTYDAVDKQEGRAVVIKRMEVRGAKTWKELELAEREVNVLRALSHSKLPAYYDHFEEDGALFLVMEKIEGESLGAMKRRRAVLSEKEVRRLLEDAADVLRYLHRRTPPVIHRDLKPGNVIRRPNGTYAFVDFGAVRERLKPEGGSTVVGTFGYMAPEQFQGRALPASDVYAIGATALTMLTGQEPEDLPHKGLAVDVRAAIGKSASSEMVDVLTKMLEPDPDKRASVVPIFDPLAGDPLRKPLEREKERSREPLRADKDERKRRKAERDATFKRLRAEEREERAARRAEKKARRHRRRDGWKPRPKVNAPPWPISMFFALGLAIASVAVVLSLKVIVPIVLRTLALFFAKDGLHRAADAVIDAGDRATQSMRRAIAWTQGEPTKEAKARIAEEQANVRVSVDGDASEEEELDEEEEPPPKKRAKL
jgi:serine/threonine protein kinase